MVYYSTRVTGAHSLSHSHLGTLHVSVYEALVQTRCTHTHTHTHTGLVVGGRS